MQKVTQFPAQRMGFADRGLLQEGKQADLVIFDAEHITDRATIKAPCVYSKGVRWLFVNGKAAIANGKTTGVKSGRVLRNCHLRRNGNG